MRHLPIFICLSGLIGGCSLFHHKTGEPASEIGENNTAEALPDDLGAQAVKLADETPAESPPPEELAPVPAPVEEPAPAPEGDTTAKKEEPTPAPAVVATPAPAVVAAPAPAPAIAAEGAGRTSAVVGPEDARRVVRYVKEDKTPIFAAPKDSADQVRTLLRGTSLMVLVDGEWAEIVPGQHIRVAALSDQPVVYTPEAQAWQARESKPTTKKE